jgi:glycosyltransferase involved in cell wall biosynthesis
MKVSIIVPVYNSSQYLRRCIESLINQNLDSYEIILVNDASTDDSLEIMKEFKSKNKKLIKIIDLDKNIKQGGARNRGIEISNGEYIGFVDSDDWVNKNMFNKLYNKAKETNSDIVDCDYYIANSSDEIVEIKQSNSKEQIGELSTQKKKNLIINSGRMWTKIFKRKLFENIKFSESVFYEDNEIMPSLMVACSKLEKVDKPLYYYFIDNQESTTSKKNDYRHFDRLITSKNIIKNFKKENNYYKYEEEIKFRFIELYYLNTINICLNQFDPPEINYLYEIRDYIHNEMPEYRKNKYFKSKINLKEKLISFINDIDPILLLLFYKAKKILKN